MDNSLIDALRHRPYLFLFPCAAIALIFGVGHWFLHALGLLADFRPIFHAMVQVQGFLFLMAAGFLLTFIPRRTQTPALGFVWMSVVVISVPLLIFFAWKSQWALAQVAWLPGPLVLVIYSARRLLLGGQFKRLPGLVWVPFAFFLAVFGTVLTAIGAANQESLWWLHQLGRDIVLQGMPLSWLIGLSTLILPLMTQGRGPRSYPPTRFWSKFILHLIFMVVFVGSFFAKELINLSLAFSLRGAVMFAALIIEGRLWLPPKKDGMTRWMIWFGGWAVSLGYFIGAFFPDYYKASQHFVFVLGFVPLVLGLGGQVVLGHCGREDLKNGYPWGLRIAFLLIVFAALCRLGMEFFELNYFTLMGAASGLLLAAISVWVFFLSPFLFGELGSLIRSKNKQESRV